jgi:CHAD domain-containing protein
LLDSQADLVSGVDPMIAAVRATGREPGETPEAPKVQLRGRDDGRAALAQVFTNLLTTMELNEEGVRQQLDPEVLHDYRVAVRRTRSIERLARPHLPDDMTRLWEPEWKWLASVTGPPRDLDVLMLDLQIDTATMTSAADAGVHELADRARARRAIEQARLQDALDGDRYATLKRGWRASINDLAATTTRNGDAPSMRADALTRETIRKATKKFVAAARAIDEDSPAELVHTARKRAKRLRYAAELLGSALPAKEVKSIVTSMKRLQDDLGDFQDAEVQLHLLHDLVADASLGEPSPNALAAVEVLTEELVAKQQTARRDLIKALRKLADR